MINDHHSLSHRTMALVRQWFDVSAAEKATLMSIPRLNDSNEKKPAKNAAMITLRFHHAAQNHT